MKKETQDQVFSRLIELQKVIKDLEGSRLNSPFNRFFLRDMFIKDYKLRAKSLAKRMNEKERIYPYLTP